MVRQERCALYWPPKEVPIITVGEDLTVTRCGVSRDGGVRVREFLLQKVGGAMPNGCEAQCGVPCLLIVNV